MNWEELFCLHSWAFKEKWTPSIKADFVTRFEMWAMCWKCGKKEKIADDRFEKEED